MMESHRSFGFGTLPTYVGFRCIPVGLIIGGYVSFTAEGDGWEWFWGYAALSAFITM